MTIIIDKKIINAALVEQKKTQQEEAVKKEPELEKVHEDLKRPELLVGSTYKIKTPMSEHALYVTINDVILNEGTAFESRRPFEVFINSKNMDHFQWVVALTRVISAVFRKGGDITFLVEELKAVFDPQGGYFKPGTGKFMPSLVAEIGEAIEHHMKRNGVIKEAELSQEKKAFISEKKKQFEQTKIACEKEAPQGQMCKVCSEQSVVIMDGCSTCLSCGDSKCG